MSIKEAKGSLSGFSRDLGRLAMVPQMCCWHLSSCAWARVQANSYSVVYVEGYVYAYISVYVQWFLCYHLGVLLGVCCLMFEARATGVIFLVLCTLRRHRLPLGNDSIN
eukprot:jgi/Botrbrau1/19017/Bobra.0100s0049.1